MGIKRSEVIMRVKVKLTIGFSIIDLRSISFYLSLNIEKNQEKKIIKLS